MKAKDLAELLLHHPEANVIHKEYVGWNPLVKIKGASFVKQGDVVNSPDKGGDFITDEEDTAETDLFILF